MHIDPTPKQAADYIKKLHTWEQKYMQFESWRKQYGDLFVKRVENLVEKK